MDLFYEMSMKGTCSKQVFCHALHPYLQKRGLFQSLLQQNSVTNASQRRGMRLTSELQRDTLMPDIINEVSQLTPISRKENGLVDGSIKHFAKVSR
jgi:hypothetical protein